MDYYLQEPYNAKKDIPKDYKNIFGNNVPNNYYQAETFIFEKRKEYVKSALKKMLEVSLIIEYYNKNVNQDEKIKNIKILIYLNYLLCWLYVLIISLPRLHTWELIIAMNKTWILINNPFCDLPLF